MKTGTFNFEGFPEEAPQFMIELKFNNNKEWFSLNRDRYIKYLKEPMELFGAEMKERLLSIDKSLDIIYAQSRINRDIRFSKDKSPYKVTKWVVFKTASKQPQPEIFFELTPEVYYIGVGIYCAPPYFMKAFRKKIEAEQSRALRLSKRLKNQSNFVLEGDKYKRNLAKNIDSDLVDWYNRKSIAIISQNDYTNDVFSRNILDITEKGFKFLIPYYKFLYEVFLNANSEK